MNINPLIYKPTLISSGIGTLGGYLLSKIDNTELRKLKYENPELYKKIKRKRALKYSLAGAGIGLGTGLAGSVGVHAYRRSRPLDGYGYSENFYHKNPKQRTGNGMAFDFLNGKRFTEKNATFPKDAGENEVNIENNDQIFNFKQNSKRFNFVIRLKNKAPSGRSMVYWGSFKGVPNPKRAINNIRRHLIRNGVAPEDGALERIKEELEKRYSFIRK